LPILPITLSRHIDLTPCHTWQTELFSEGRDGLIVNVCQHPNYRRTRPRQFFAPFFLFLGKRECFLITMGKPMVKDKTKTQVDVRCSRTRGYIEWQVSLRSMGLVVRPTCPSSSKMISSNWTCPSSSKMISSNWSPDPRAQCLDQRGQGIQWLGDC